MDGLAGSGWTKLLCVDSRMYILTCLSNTYIYVNVFHYKNRNDKFNFIKKKIYTTPTITKNETFCGLNNGCLNVDSLLWFSSKFRVYQCFDAENLFLFLLYRISNVFRTIFSEQFLLHWWMDISKQQRMFNANAT